MMPVLWVECKAPRSSGNNLPSATVSRLVGFEGTCLAFHEHLAERGQPRFEGDSAQRADQGPVITDQTLVPAWGLEGMVRQEFF